MMDETGDGSTASEAAARVASEMRHRYANTFQFLAALARMRSQKAVEPELKRQLGWLADAVGSLGVLERHRGLQGVDLVAYLSEMAPVWRRRQGHDAAEVVLEAEPCLLSDNAAAAVAVIAQELIGNALAHGFPNGGGRIVVRLSGADRDGRCQLVVTDDGCGFDPDSEAGRDRFGLWLAKSLAGQARGRLEVATGPGGTVGRLEFSA